MAGSPFEELDSGPRRPQRRRAVKLRSGIHPAIVALLALCFSLASCMLPLLPDIIAVLLPSSGSGIDTRSEFRRKLIGRNQKQVIEAVGKPDSTQESGRHRYWYYEGRTRDEVTGNIDSRAQVCFEDGIVTSVNY